MTLIGWDWSWYPWSGLPGRASVAEAHPPINVYESAEAYGLEAEIPGADADRLEVSVEGDTLTISGEQLAQEGKGAFHRRERPRGRFSRVVRFPLRLNATEVEAHYSEGVLTLRLAKAPEAKARRIAVKGG